MTIIKKCSTQNEIFFVGINSRKFSPDRSTLLPIQAFAVLFACLSVAAGDTWSCEECDRGQQELTNILTSEAGLEIQVKHIISDYCPYSDDADNCEAFVPDFWKAIAMQLWPEHMSHLCEDKETCESGLQLTCLDCQWRIKWSLQILREPMTEQYWVAKLRKGGFCSENYRGFEEICDGHLDDTFLNALHWMTDNSWVNSFCYDNFGCQA